MENKANAEMVTAPKEFSESLVMRLTSLIEKEDAVGLKELVGQSNPVIVANSLAVLTRSQRLFFFRVLPGDLTANVFSYLDFEVQQDIVASFTDQETQKVMSHLSTDDLVDFLDDLPSNLVTKVLASCTKENRALINQLLKFKPGTAGSIMTTDYFTVKEGMDCGQALVHLRETGPKGENLWTAFVLDPTRKLIGTINLDKLLFADPTTPLSNVMNEDFSFAYSNTDDEKVAKMFNEYDVSTLPVVDREGRLVGIITFDDVMDVAEREATEDIKKSSAVSAANTKPYLKSSTWEIAKSYFIWLIVLLALNTFTSMVLSRIQNQVVFSTILPLLIAFIPTLSGTCSNASDQTTTVIIRELAIGNVSPKDYRKVFSKEMRAALVTALAVALFSFGWVLVELYGHILKTSGNNLGELQSQDINTIYVAISGLISLTFVVCIMFAKWIGMSLPMLAKTIRIDPATMSQPLISNVLDMVSMAVFLGFSILIISPMAV